MFSRFLLLILFTWIILSGKAQEHTIIRINYKDKPTKYQTKVLPVEKSGIEHLKGVKKFFQNTYTHFNYIFNANTKLTQLLKSGKENYQNDYLHLLDYYDYDTAQLAKNQYLDTVLEKSNGALVLHDLRQDWNDEVYLLLGKAYFYKNKYDTAAMHFQYLNYAYAPKDDGYDIPIGSNISNKEHEFTVSNHASKSILKHGSRRNIGMIWIARSLVAEKEYGVANGILQILTADKYFPEKLLPELNDCKAYLYYNLHKYDSAAHFLELSHSVSTSNLEDARRHFLEGQLWILSGNRSDAIKAFEYAYKHSPDMVMEIYATLHAINASSENGDDNQEEVKHLQILAKKDKYKQQRDLIFYLLAQQNIKAKDTASAIKNLYSSLAYAQANTLQKSLSFKLLADIQEYKPDYRYMAQLYDSISTPYTTDQEEFGEFTKRRNATDELLTHLNHLYYNDSIMQLASLPENERNKILKAKVKSIRKALGLKEEDNTSFSFNNQNNSNTTTDLFGTTNSKEGWYFNSTTLSSSGYQKFKSLFGNRPNVDNWNREAAIQLAVNVPTPNTSGEIATQVDSALVDLAYLQNQLPLTKEQKDSVQNVNATAYLHAGEVMQNRLENYPAAFEYFQKALDLTSDKDVKIKALYAMSQMAILEKNTSLASSLQQNILQLNNGQPYRPINANTRHPQMEFSTSEKDEATKIYAQVYNLLIEGEFKASEDLKKRADSIYGNYFWTPQLLYIESIYNVSERRDSLALNQLDLLIARFSTSPIKEKAVTFREVLSRRREIEDYLTHLEIKPIEDDDNVYIPNGKDQSIISVKDVQIRNRDTLQSKLAANAIQIKKLETLSTMKDSSKNERHYLVDLSKPQYVVLILDKVAQVFANESVNGLKRYNDRTFGTNKINVKMIKLDDRYQMTLIGPFDESGSALEYFDKISPVFATRILPWLDKTKYTFTMISDDNLELLQEVKTLDLYKETLRKLLPSKF